MGHQFLFDYYWYLYLYNPTLKVSWEKLLIKHTYKCVVSGERYFNKNKPIGDPIAIPINEGLYTITPINFIPYIWNQSKILMKTSSINFMGTISIAGSIKETLGGMPVASISY